MDDSYEIIIREGDYEDGDRFEARVRELPNLLAYAKTYEDAYLEIQDLIASAKFFFRWRIRFVTAESCAEDGKSMPKPLTTGESDE